MKDPTATVQAKLMAQRRRPKDAKNGVVWADADSFDLRTLKPNEHVVLDLGPNQTKSLFLTLARRYAEAKQLNDVLESISLTAVNPEEVTVIQGKARETLEKLIEQEGNEVWEHLSSMHPDMLKTVSLRQQHENRKQALSQFKEHLDSNDWLEKDWQKFFTNHPWIFGFGLASQFVTIVDDQPHYGGMRFDGTGAQRGDYLARTEAIAKFTVVVEIKKPETELIDKRQTYRNGAYRIHEDLAGGVAQVQANCETWLTDGSRDRANARELENENTLTSQPKGILIIGCTSEFENDVEMSESFERFRRLLHNPEVITFDELYVRTEHLLQIESENNIQDTIVSPF